MQRIFGLACALVVAGCSATPPAAVEKGMPVPGNENISETMVQSDERDVQGEEIEVDAEVGTEIDTSAMQIREEPKGSSEVKVSVENWAFRPSMLRFKKGQAATVTFNGVSGVHGVVVPDLGINQSVNLGQTVSVVIPTDRAGTFGFRCSVPCGPGHREMVGEIVIEE